MYLYTNIFSTNHFQLKRFKGILFLIIICSRSDKLAFYMYFNIVAYLTPYLPNTFLMVSQPVDYRVYLFRFLHSYDAWRITSHLIKITTKIFFTTTGLLPHVFLFFVFYLIEQLTEQPHRFSFLVFFFIQRSPRYIHSTQPVSVSPFFQSVSSGCLCCLCICSPFQKKSNSNQLWSSCNSP